MRRRLMATFTAICFLLAPLHALAHGGSLNRDGCHNETTTGGYHCHRDQGDDDEFDWETVGIVVGGLVLLAVVARVVTDQMDLSLTDTDAADPRMGVIPYLAKNDAFGLDAYYDVSPFSRLGMRMEHGSDRDESRIGASWAKKF